MKKLIMITAMGAALLFTADALHARRGPGGDGDTRERRGDLHGRMGEECGPGTFFGEPQRLKTALGLSDEQVKKISAINEDYRRRFRVFRDDISPLHGKLRNELLKPKIDLEEVKRLLQKIADINVEIRLLKIKHQLDIELALTPEQREKLRGEKRQMRGRQHRPEL